MEEKKYRKRGTSERRPELKTLATNITSLIYGCKMTQQQFADSIGFNRMVISNWTRARTEPKYEAWIELEKISGYSRNELKKHLISPNEIPKLKNRSLEMVQEPDMPKYGKPLFRFDASEAEQAISELKNEIEKLERRVQKLESKG